MPFFITQATGENEQDRYHRVTARGTYIVRDTTMQGERVRLLLVDGIQESATHLDPARRYEPMFRYLTFFQKIVEEYPDPQQVLLIGGAGFAYPKLFFSSGQKGNMTVVELDPRMIRLADRFFFLRELKEEYDLDRTGRLRIVVDEGLHFLREDDGRYDIIINDAYLGNVPDEGLLSEEGIAACKTRLKPGGILVTNIITPLGGPGSMPGILAKKRYEQFFDRVSLYTCDPSHPATMRQNCMLTGQDIPGRVCPGEGAGGWT
ncbi:MAG: fused MFS/spermidine synthase [Lachnospiraceae bacterium]|nr:fused MFS/spermidine synthase [Lachnospiraceae bacterium]